MANNPLTPCGCPGVNVNDVCGEFDDPTTPDQGKCHPYRLKTDCEAPVVPSPTCNDSEAVIILTPTLTPPFRLQSRLYDEDCNLITDEDGNSIVTQSY